MERFNIISRLQSSRRLRARHLAQSAALLAARPAYPSDCECQSCHQAWWHGDQIVGGVCGLFDTTTGNLGPCVLRSMVPVVSVSCNS